MGALSASAVVLTTAALLAAARAVPAGASDGSTVPASPPRASPATESSPATTAGERVEHFRFEDALGRELGRAVWRRSPSPRGLQLERQLRWHDTAEGSGESGVSQVECLERELTRHVYREIGPGGRVVLAEWDRARDELRAFEWSACGVRREVLATAGSAALPLYLCELAREGRLIAGRIGCFDPLEQGIVDLEVRTSYATSPGPAGNAPIARTVELRRADGTLFLRLCFQGTQLGSFQLQEGGPWAVRTAPPAPADGDRMPGSGTGAG